VVNDDKPDTNDHSALCHLCRVQTSLMEIYGRVVEEVSERLVVRGRGGVECRMVVRKRAVDDQQKRQ